MAAKHRVGSKIPVKERFNFVHEAVVASCKIKYYFNGCFDSGAGLFSICKFIPLSYSLYFLYKLSLKSDLTSKRISTE